MKNEKYTMERAIREEAEYLHSRKISKEKARERYDEYDTRYQDALLRHRDNWTHFYISREGAALYMQEAFGVKV